VTADTVPRIEGPGPQDFRFNFVGDTALAGELSRTLAFQRFRGSVDVTSTTSWSVSVIGSTAEVLGPGSIRINTVSNTGSITVTATRDGVPVSMTVPINKVLAAAPPATGSRTASGAVSFTTASTSFVTALETTVTTSASGTSLSVSAVMNVWGSAGYAGTEAKWQIFISGSWSDISPGAQASEHISVPEFGISYGSVAISRTRTGLSSSTAYPLRLQVRRASGTGDQAHSGDFAAEAA
jgi:hypothetical protein